MHERRNTVRKIILKGNLSGDIKMTIRIMQNLSSSEYLVRIKDNKTPTSQNFW